MAKVPNRQRRHPKTWAWARGSSRSTCTPAALPVRVSPLPHGSQSSGLTRGSRSGEWLMSSSHLRGASPPRDRNTDAGDAEADSMIGRFGRTVRDWAKGGAILLPSPRSSRLRTSRRPSRIRRSRVRCPRAIRDRGRPAEPDPAEEDRGNFATRNQPARDNRRPPAVGRAGDLGTVPPNPVAHGPSLSEGRATD